jgi:hypothetical protein
MLKPAVWPPIAFPGLLLSPALAEKRLSDEVARKVEARAVATAKTKTNENRDI